MMNGDTT